MSIQIDHTVSQITQDTGSGLTQANGTNSRTGLRDIKLIRNVEITYAELTSQCADLLNIYSMCYNNDGTILYLVEGSTSTASTDARKTIRIHYTTLSTAYDVSTKDTWSYLDIVLNTAPNTSYNAVHTSMQFGDSGNYLYIYTCYRYFGAPDGITWYYWYPYIERHTLSTPYDITTASYDSYYNIWSYTNSGFTDQRYGHMTPSFAMNADYLTWGIAYNFAYSLPTPSSWALPTSSAGAQSQGYGYPENGYTPYSWWYENSGTEAFAYASEPPADGRAYLYGTTIGRFTSLPTTNRVTSASSYAYNNSYLTDHVHGNSYNSQEGSVYSASASFKMALEGVDELLNPRFRNYRPADSSTDVSSYALSSITRYNYWSGNMVPHGDTYTNGISRLNLYTPANATYNVNVGQELSIDQYGFGIGTLKTSGVEELKTYSKKFQVNAPVVVIGGSSINAETDQSLRALQFQKIFIGTASDYYSNYYLASRVYIGYKYASGTPDSKIWIGEPNGTTNIGGSVYLGGRAHYGAVNPSLVVSTLDTLSAYGYLTISGSSISNPTTPNAPSINATGFATNIDIELNPKGTGRVAFGTYTAGAVSQTGYISIRDSSGNSRRLLVG